MGISSQCHCVCCGCSESCGPDACRGSFCVCRSDQGRCTTLLETGRVDCVCGACYRGVYHCGSAGFVMTTACNHRRGIPLMWQVERLDPPCPPICKAAPGPVTFKGLLQTVIRIQAYLRDYRRGTDKDPGTKGIWAASLQVFQDAPFFGHGAGNAMDAVRDLSGYPYREDNVHNYPLQVLLDFASLGLPLLPQWSSGSLFRALGAGSSARFRHSSCCTWWEEWCNLPAESCWRGLPSPATPRSDQDLSRQRA